LSDRLEWDLLSLLFLDIFVDGAFGQVLHYNVHVRVGHVVDDLVNVNDVGVVHTFHDFYFIESQRLSTRHSSLTQGPFLNNFHRVELHRPVFLRLTNFEHITEGADAKFAYNCVLIVHFFVFLTFLFSLYLFLDGSGESGVPPIFLNCEFRAV
jgi:hypothetical protein